MYLVYVVRGGDVSRVRDESLSICVYAHEHTCEHMHA